MKRQLQAWVTTQGARGEDLRSQAHGSFLLNAHCGGGELSPPLPRWGPGGSWLTSELRGCRGHSQRSPWAADVFGRVCLRAVCLAVW